MKARAPVSAQNEQVSIPLASYAVVMGTGIVSIALMLDHQRTLSRIWLGIAAATWLALAAAMGGRLVRAPDQLLREARSPTSLTSVAATAVLGSWFVSSGVEWAGIALLLTAVAIWLGLSALLLRHRHLPRSGSTFLVTVSVQSLATLAALLAPVAGERWLVYAAIGACGIGIALYLLALARFDPRELLTGSGDQWVAGGAVAITALAAASSGLGVARLGGPHGVAAIVRDISVVTWAASVAWLAALVAAELASRRPRYDLRRWSTVFPVGMYAASSFEVARVAHLQPVRSFASGCTWAALALWLIVSAGMVRGRGALASPS